jgi:hypothetical protein
MTTLAWKNHRFLWGYLAAFLICWVTQAIFWAISWRRGSLLAFTLLRFEDFVRITAERVAGRPVLPYPPPPYAGSVVGAALLVALPLAGVFWLAGAENRASRWLGYALLALLAFMAFYWPRIPNNIF